MNITKTVSPATSQLPIFVINLKRSPERRDRIAEQLDKMELQYTFFDAVDGTEEHPLFAHYNPAFAKKRYGRELALGELGCFASHFSLWQHCADGDVPFVILEDDAILRESFREALTVVEERIHKYNYLRLSATVLQDLKIWKRARPFVDIVRFKKGPLDTVCYAITPSAALRLLKSANVWFEPVDCHMDRFWKHGLKSLAIFPLPVTHDLHKDLSDIWNGRPEPERSTRITLQRLSYCMSDRVFQYINNISYFLK